MLTQQKESFHFKEIVWNLVSNFKKVLWIVQSSYSSCLNIILVVIAEAFIFCLKLRFSCKSPFRLNEGFRNTVFDGFRGSLGG